MQNASSSPRRVMRENFNPFTEQIVVEYFVGREHQIRQFSTDLSGLRAGIPNHQFVAGLEGSGKTSYLAKLAQVARSAGLLAATPTLDPGARAHAQVGTIIGSIVGALDDATRRSLRNDWNRGKDSQYFLHPRSDELRGDAIGEDFKTLATMVQDSQIAGILVCIDEGQRIDGRALSALKNALQYHKKYLIVISLRLISDAGGTVAAGRAVLDAKAADAEGDIGASRFYVSGVPLGPFDTDEEAADCLRRRLQDNVIQFESCVIERIGRIAGRVPKTLISLSNAVYMATQQAGAALASRPLLDSTFRNVHRRAMEEALTVLANSSTAARTALRGLVALRVPATPLTIALHVYPTAPAEAHADLAAAVQVHLERLCATSTLCIRSSDLFEFATPAHAYALELALEQD